MNTWRFTVFGLVFVGFSLPIVVHLLTHPALLWRRLRGGPLAEPEPRQRLIISLILLCVVALGVVCVFDYGLRWSQVPVSVMLLGDLLVGASLLLIWLVIRVNPFAASAVTVEPGQTVVTTGPYALVRHPMYSGGLLLFLGLPSRWGPGWGSFPFSPSGRSSSGGSRMRSAISPTTSQATGSTVPRSHTG